MNYQDETRLWVAASKRPGDLKYRTPPSHREHTWRVLNELTKKHEKGFTQPQIMVALISDYESAGREQPLHGWKVHNMSRWLAERAQRRYMVPVK